MILPRKDDKGYYLSYSQIALFKRSKEDFFKSYVLNEPFEGNVWTAFGERVGKAIEHNHYIGFSHQEREILKSVTKLDFFEVEVELKYPDFRVKGFIDSTDFVHIIDYKTGGYGKEVTYMTPGYTQVQLYAAALRQEGFIIKEAWVEFVTRVGNPYKGEELKVANIPPLRIDQDVRLKTLKRVMEETEAIAKEISEWYREKMQELQAGE